MDGSAGECWHSFPRPARSPAAQPANLARAAVLRQLASNKGIQAEAEKRLAPDGRGRPSLHFNLKTFHRNRARFSPGWPCASRTATLASCAPGVPQPSHAPRYKYTDVKNPHTPIPTSTVSGHAGISRVTATKVQKNIRLAEIKISESMTLASVAEVMGTGHHGKEIARFSGTVVVRGAASPTRIAGRAGAEGIRSSTSPGGVEPAPPEPLLETGLRRSSHSAGGQPAVEYPRSALRPARKDLPSSPPRARRIAYAG